MRPGFTLIEVVLAIGLTSIIVLTLFNSFFQMNRTTQTVQDIIDIETQIAIIQNQLEKDITGAFVPVVSKVPVPSDKKTAGQEQKKQVAAKKADAAEQKKKIKQVFYGVNKGGMLSELTFLSTNPVRVYEKAENSKPKPRLVRIFYKLIPTEGMRNAYTLIRQEGQELDAKKYAGNAIVGYPVAENIKQISVEYLVPEEQSKEDEKKGKQVSFKSFNEWREPEERGEKLKKWIMPQVVKVTIVLWDNQQTRERTYSFGYILPGSRDQIEKPKPVPPEKPQTDLKKTATQLQQKPGQKKQLVRVQARIKPKASSIRGGLNDLRTQLAGKGLL